MVHTVQHVSVARCRVARLTAALVDYFRGGGVPAIAFWEIQPEWFGGAVPDALVLLPGARLPTCVFFGQPIDEIQRNEALYSVVRVNPSASDLVREFAMSNSDAKRVLANSSVEVEYIASAREHTLACEFERITSTVRRFTYTASCPNQFLSCTRRLQRKDYTHLVGVETEVPTTAVIAVATPQRGR